MLNHSVVKRQSIGNCGLYVTASWLQLVHKAATASSSTAPSPTGPTGIGLIQDRRPRRLGPPRPAAIWLTASTIIKKYGIIPEGDFIAFLERGFPLRRPPQERARRDEPVHQERRALDRDGAPQQGHRPQGARQGVRARASAIAQLDKVFGVTVARNLTTRSTTTGNYTASTAGTRFKRAKGTRRRPTRRARACRW